MPKVHVKWGGNRYDLDVDTQNDPVVFKAQLFELTGVLPERQKVVFKVCLIYLSTSFMKITFYIYHYLGQNSQG